MDRPQSSLAIGPEALERFPMVVYTSTGVWEVFMRIRLIALGLVVGGLAAGAERSVTFHKDVLPILQARCQACHRPGEVGPMPLLTYSQARPFAKAIREAVLLKKMPPWFADPGAGKFRNDQSLARAEVETLKAWADTGAAEGDPGEAPPARQFVDGWQIGEPDVTIEMPKAYQVAATGTIEYTYVIIPTNFGEDRWIQSAEIRPGNRAVVHHIVGFTREPGSKWLREYPIGEPFVPAPRPGTKRRSSDGDRLEEGTLNDEWMVGYAPGMPADRFEPGQARLLKKGADLVLSLHYTTNGKAAEDRSRVGLIFAKEPPRQRIYTLGARNNKFVIPPGAANHKVEASATLKSGVELVYLQPHMHLRGKAAEMRAVYPTGEREVLLRVPRYDFNWQLNYMPATAKVLPKGTRIEATCVFDNSVNNPHNPDPKAEVRWGDQSWEEMAIGFFIVAFDPKIELKDLLEEQKKKDGQEKKQVAEARR